MPPSKKKPAVKNLPVAVVPTDRLVLADAPSTGTALVPVNPASQEIVTQGNVARVTGYAYRTANHVLPDAVVFYVDPHLSRSDVNRGEADKIAWRDPKTGYECIVLRDPDKRYLRGFVGIPPSHPLYGYSHDAIPTDLGLEVHGGLTYGKACEVPAQRETWVREAVRICHTTIRPIVRKLVAGTNATDHKAHDDAWWLGFDCCHPGDLVPRRHHSRVIDGVRPVYRDDDYVVSEVLHLAAQLQAIELGIPMPVRPGPPLSPMSLQPESTQERGDRK